MLSWFTLNESNREFLHKLVDLGGVTRTPPARGRAREIKAIKLEEYRSIAGGCRTALPSSNVPSSCVYIVWAV